MKGKCVTVGNNSFAKIYNGEGNLYCNRENDSCKLYNSLEECKNSAEEKTNLYKCLVDYLKDPNHLCNKFTTTKCIKNINDNTFSKFMGVNDLAILYYQQDGNNKNKKFASENDCKADSLTYLNKCTGENFADKKDACNNANKFFSTEEISYNCKKIFEGIFKEEEEEEEEELSAYDKFIKAADIAKMILEMLWEEKLVIISIMAIESFGEFIGPYLLKKLTTKVATKLSVRIGTVLIKAFISLSNFYTMITLAEAAVSIGRMVAGVPLKNYITGDIIEQIFNDSYNSFVKLTTENEEINCMRNFFYTFMIQKGFDPTMINIDQFLEGSTSLYKVIDYAPVITKDISLEEYYPCLSDISNQPCYCDVNKFKIIPGYEDLSGRKMAAGVPTYKADDIYKRGFNLFLNSPYNIPFGNDLEGFDADTLRLGEGDDCNDNNYLNCSRGDIVSCSMCLKADRKPPPLFDPFNSSSNILTLETPTNQNNNRQNNINTKYTKIMLWLLIIFCLLLLYFLFCKK
jgi:hypothetical protein